MTRHTALPLLAALALACGTPMGTRLVAQGNLERDQEAYTSYVRLGLFEEALDYVEPSQRAAFRELVAEFSDVRMTEAVALQTTLDREANAAVFEVRYEGYRLSSPTPRRFAARQRWRHDDDAKRWYVSPDLAALRALAGRAGPST
jgi:hypothetical protein